MQVVKEYPDGVFSWVDLASPDIEGSKTFYGGLLGWSALDIPGDSGVIYSMCQIEGLDVAGIGPMDPDMRAQGVPPFWTSYVNHSDVDAVAARAVEAGGVIMMPPFDVMESGRMAIIQDPSGAVFGVWQPKEHIGAKLVNIPNTLTWNELQTNDIEGAKSFYAAVLGWTYTQDESGYVVCYVDGRHQAGMMAITEEMENVPPNWTLYFLVDDIEAKAKKVAELGGNVIVPPTQAGEMGKFSVVQDAQGGFFSLIEYAGPADPPPGY